MSGQLRLSITGAVVTATTALSLHTVFAGRGWLVPILGAVLLVFATTSAARGARLPSVFHPLAAAVVVLLWITFLDARQVAVAGVIPGPGAFRQLGRVTRTGLNDVHRLATPVPTHRGILLLAVVGVAGVALVVDLLVVQFRRCALAGLPLLGLFTTSAAVGRHGAGIVSYVLSATAFLWLLFVDSQEQVTRWGTSVTTQEQQRRRNIWSEDISDPPPGATPTALGRRIGGAAIGFGVFIPLLIPGLHTGIDRHYTGTGSGGNGSNIVTVNPIVSIASDLTASNAESILSYRTTTPDPGYLRLTALDLFDGKTFSASPLVSEPDARVDGTVPGAIAPPTQPNAAVTTAVTVTHALSLHWLPVDTVPRTVKVGGDWRYDAASATIFSSKDSTSGVRYTTTSVPVDPTAGQLASATQPGPALAADLSLPQDLSPRVRQLAHTITKRATTSYADAIAIQDYLAKGHGFVYDTSVRPDNGPDPLADFLLRSRRGFCQQFSASMAVLARVMGIPARVAVGFTRGTKQPDGSWLVTTRDAHAWPELWFQGVGWVPFEPTPRADGQAVQPAYAATSNGKASKGSTGKNSNTANPNTKPKTGSLPKGLQQPLEGSGGGGVITSAARVHSTSRSSWVDLALLLIALSLLIPVTLRLVWRWGRRRRMAAPATAAAAAWAELRAAALDLRAPWDDMFPPRRAAAGVARALPRERTVLDALTRVAIAEEQSRYARDPGPAQPELWADVDRVATALRSRLRPLQRVRYRVFPRSVLLSLRSLSGRAADVLDGADSWIARSRRLLRGRLGAGSAGA